MNIKHRLYTRNYAEVAIPNSLNDSTLVKFLQSIAGVKPESWTSRWQDRIEVNGNLLECIVLENFVDSFRIKNPQQVKFSWWSNMYKAREKNNGWRIDYFLISKNFKFEESDIHDQVMGSDHAPIQLII